MRGKPINWEQISPWQLPGLSALLRLILAWGLIEGIRSGFYAGYMPIHNETLGFSTTTLGAAWTLHLLSDSLGKGIGGWLTQRFGLGLVCVAAGLVGWVAIAYVPYIQSPIALFVVSVFWGLGVAGILPGLMTLSSRQASSGREGRAITLTSLLVTPWSGIGFFGIGLVTKVDPNVAIWILIVCQIIVTVIGVSLLFKPAKVGAQIVELYPWRRLLLFIPAAFGQTFAPALFSLFLLKFAQDSLKIGIEWIIALVAIGGAIFYGLTLVASRYADRKSPRGLLIGGLLIYGIALIWIGLNPSLGQLFIIAVLAGIGLGAFTPAWNSLVVRVLPEQNRAAAWGTIMAFETIGHAVGPVVGGTLISLSGSLNTPFLVAGCINLAMSLFYVITLWRPWWKQSQS